MRVAVAMPEVLVGSYLVEMRIVNQPDSGDHPLTLLLLAEDGLQLLDAVGGGQPCLARQAAIRKDQKYFWLQSEKGQNFSESLFFI